jgi:hypothetical protein
MPDDTPPMPNSLQRIDRDTHSDDPMVNMIERIVLDPAASIEKLERVIALKVQLEDREQDRQAREQKQDYFRAMAACQAELKVVVKNQKNTHTSSTYADLAAIAKQADPIIHKWGFTVSFQPAGLSERGDLRIKWTIAHQGGHIESDTAEIPMDTAGSKGNVNKTPTQAFGSTMSYGRRYLKLSLFDIATGDDNDGNAIPEHQPISEKQVERIFALIEETNTNAIDFCRHFNIDHVAGLPQARFVDAMNMFARKKKLQETQRPPDADL